MRSLNGTAKLADAVDRLLAEAGERHGDRLVMLCSFQKEESVLLDAVSRVAPATRLAANEPDGRVRFVVRARRAFLGDGRFRPEPFPRLDR